MAYKNIFIRLFITISFLFIITDKAFSSGWQINDRGTKGADAIVNLYIPQLKKWSHLIVDISVRNRCNPMLAVSLKNQKTLGRYINHNVNPNFNMTAKISNKSYNLTTKIYAKYNNGFEIGSNISKGLLNSLMREVDISIFVFQNKKQIMGINYPLVGAKQAITIAYNKCKRYS
jgi:hypothetical protein